MYEWRCENSESMLCIQVASLAALLGEKSMYWLVQEALNWAMRCVGLLALLRRRGLDLTTKDLACEFTPLKPCCEMAERDEWITLFPASLTPVRLFNKAANLPAPQDVVMLVSRCECLCDSACSSKQRQLDFINKLNESQSLCSRLIKITALTSLQIWFGSTSVGGVTPLQWMVILMGHIGIYIIFNTAFYFILLHKWISHDWVGIMYFHWTVHDPENSQYH